jgi:hypothetical protein
VEWDMRIGSGFTVNMNSLRYANRGSTFMIFRYDRGNECMLHYPKMNGVSSRCGLGVTDSNASSCCTS